LDVVIEGGNFTNTTDVVFGAGIVVNDFTIESPSRIIANITISPSAEMDVYNASVFADGKRYNLPYCFTINDYEQIPLTVNYTPATANNQEISVIIETAPGALCTAIAVSSSGVSGWSDRIAGDTGIISWTAKYRNFYSERHQLTITAELRGKTTSKHIVVNY